MKQRVWLVAAIIAAAILLLGLLMLSKLESPVTPPPPVVAAARAKPAPTAPLTIEEALAATNIVPVTTGPFTNAADIYRQAFALFDALTEDEKEILKNWQTNVDADVAAALCEKVRPICNLMHEASQVTNCDWGIERPMRPETKLSHLAPARALARTAGWTANHCRAGVAAADDVVSMIRLGRQVNSSAIIGSLVDIAIEGIGFACVSSNVAGYASTGGEELLNLFMDQEADELPSRAILREAEYIEQIGTDLAAKPPDQAAQELSTLATGFGDEEPVKMDLATGLAEIKKVADSERELAQILTTGSSEQYAAWLNRMKGILDSVRLAKAFLPITESVVDKYQAAAINRTMVAAALAIVMNGDAALTKYPDPSTGEPFAFRKVTGGFELQSPYKFKDKPITIFFPTP